MVEEANELLLVTPARSVAGCSNEARVVLRCMKLSVVLLQASTHVRDSGQATDDCCVRLPCWASCGVLPNTLCQELYSLDLPILPPLYTPQTRWVMVFDDLEMRASSPYNGGVLDTLLWCRSFFIVLTFPRPLVRTPETLLQKPWHRGVGGRVFI